MLLFHTLYTTTLTVVSATMQPRMNMTIELTTFSIALSLDGASRALRTIFVSVPTYLREYASMPSD